MPNERFEETKQSLKDFGNKAYDVLTNNPASKFLREKIEDHTSGRDKIIPVGPNAIQPVLRDEPKPYGDASKAKISSPMQSMKK